MVDSDSFQTILGVRFYTGKMEGLLHITFQGGLIIAPSAPVLVDLVADSAHRTALESSELALTDSGFMVLLWCFLKGRRLPRISGLKYLRTILGTPEFRKQGASFWIMPSAEDMAANCAWLKQQGLNVNCDDCYVAPIYFTGLLEDRTLLTLIENRRPQFIVLCVGGGVQERLGFYLRSNLSAFKIANAEGLKPEAGFPAIICTGAAIAFLSGRQANIPVWADKFMLGWFLRCLREPAKYAPRYWRALKLVPLIWRFGTSSVASAPKLH